MDKQTENTTQEIKQLSQKIEESAERIAQQESLKKRKREFLPDPRISYRYNPDYHKLADFLGIDKEKRDDLSIAEKLDLIREWGIKKTGSTQLIDTLMAIKKLKRKLGLNLQGETLVKALYKYLRLSLEKETIKKEMELLKGEVEKNE